MQTNSAKSRRPGNDQAMSYEEFYRELFAGPQKPLTLGPRPGLEPPALPARSSSPPGATSGAA